MKGVIWFRGDSTHFFALFSFIKKTFSILALNYDRGQTTRSSDPFFTRKRKVFEFWNEVQDGVDIIKMAIFIGGVGERTVRRKKSSI